jgi:hypothetical protein
MDKELKQVTANLEYLKKLFIMPDSPDKFIEFGHELLEEIVDTQNRIGPALWTEFSAAYQRIINPPSPA